MFVLSTVLSCAEFTMSVLSTVLSSLCLCSVVLSSLCLCSVVLHLLLVLSGQAARCRETKTVGMEGEFIKEGADIAKLSVNIWDELLDKMVCVLIHHCLACPCFSLN